MRRAVLAAVIAASAIRAAGQDFSARGIVGYQLYDFGARTQSGWRQTYDLGLSRAVTGNSRLRLFVRMDDFRGVSEAVQSGFREKIDSRQWQPMGEFAVDAETLLVQFRADQIRDTAYAEPDDVERLSDRVNGSLRWEPHGLPSLNVIANRNSISDRASTATRTDESASATLQYPWRGLSSSAEVRTSRTADAASERDMQTARGTLAYAATALGGALSFSADIAAERSDLSEQAASGSGRVAVPLSLRAVLHGVDDTPSDNRDHALSPIPGLRDGNLNGITIVSLGPGAVSFQNIALDFGRPELADEIRVVVRDGAGNPLRTGGGPVTWDAYVSEDGQLWAPIPSTTSVFDTTNSTYRVRFAQLTTRWVKVVNFGVRADEAFVSEVQAFYFSVIAPGTSRDGSQQMRTGAVSLSWQPVRRLVVGYSGNFTELEQEFGGVVPRDERFVDQSASFQFDLARWLILRSSYGSSQIRGSLTGSDGNSAYMAGLDYVPTPQLRVTLETSRQSQTILGSPSTIDTRAVRVYGFPVRALTISLDAGVQTQTLPGMLSSARRTFANVMTTAQLTRRSRLTLNASLQRSEADDAADPAALLLGAARDDRYSAEFTWRPGRPLTLTTRVGYVQSPGQSGFTHRYRTEWFPFSDGSVSLSLSYDQDIDPINDRRASRLVFNPRWTMSRFLAFDLNYTAVQSETAFRNDQQKTFLASLMVTR